MKRAGRRSVVFAEYMLWFLMTAVIIMVAVLVYDKVSEATDSRAVVALVIIAVICALAGLLTALDALRRRYMTGLPVRKITDATERIAAGDFSVRIAPARALEAYNGYGEIMDNVNAMAEELGKTSVLNKDFISNVSHEFKTPLSVICTYAYAIADGRLTDEETRSYARTLAETASRLSSLTTNILRLNRMEHQPPPEFRPTDIGESLRHSVIAFEDAAEEKGVALECDVCDGAVALSDEGLLELIWNNLLSNAVKFTPRGGMVRVTLAQRGGEIAAEISDSGCGMNEGVGEHIFDKFYQGDTSHASEGNGLGLALVKKAIDLLGCVIDVESSPGEGSTFRVRFAACDRERVSL